MKYDYLSNVPLEQAVEEYLSALERAGMKLNTETVPTVEALDRITAQAVYAVLCAPHYHAAAMDGIALEARRTFGASETTPAVLRPGEYTPVDTGDPIPADCDAVVMIEDVVEQDGAVHLYAPAAPWQHIRQIGEDISAGDMILPSFTRITPAAMGALLAGGVGELPVLRRPVVGIIPTGDEIVPPSSNPAVGEVMEFNSAIFSGMLARWGAQPKVYPIVKDDRAKIKTAICQAAEECDALLIGAGTSAGRDDYTVSVLEELGTVVRHGVAIKPGKPAVLAHIGTVPVVGVPGYPVSGILVLEELFYPVLCRMLRQPVRRPAYAEVRLGRRLNSSLKYREFVRARLSPGPDGVPVATPLNRGAGVVTSFVKADCILDIPQNAEGAEKGELCRARLLRPLEDLEHTLAIVGSHDPLLDEAADLLRRAGAGFSVSSTHVGSMGAVTAIKGGEAVMGAVHLLDEETGTYNVPQLRRFFPDGRAVLVECVQRTQGLMVAPGNPMGLRDLDDIIRTGARYVNRQRGAGTRILCDYLLKQAGREPSPVNGYTREELTHTAVAAQIAAGTADAGLGIYSAAKLYGLDFIPVCQEQYDLLVLRGALDTPVVKAFLSVLGSEAFRLRLEALGGYELRRPGQIREE